MTPRRRTVGVVAGLLLIAGALGALLIAQDDDAVDAPSSRPAVAPEGSLRVGVPELPATYNPFDPGSRGPAANQILRMVLPQLFDVAPDGSVRGRLVDDDSIEVTGLTVRFRFAEGARWSDGVAMGAADLRFTLDAIRSSAWPGPDAGYDQIKAIEGEGADVTMRFSGRLPGWKRLFSGDDYVLPAHRLEGEDVASVWSAGPDVAGGPYLLTGSTPGLDVVLSANPRWWGEGPGVADLRVLTVPDATTLFQLLEREELDLVWMPAYTERTPQLEDVEGVDVVTGPPGGRLLSAYMQTERVKQGVRLAALDLIDRDRFVEVLFESEAQRATSWGLLRRDVGWPNWVIDEAKADAEGRQDFEVVTPEEEPMAALFVRALQLRARRTSFSFDSIELGNDLLDGEWLPEGRFDLALVDEVQWPVPCWRCRFDPQFNGETNWSRVGEGVVDDLVALATRADRGDVESAARLERRLERAGVLLPLWRPAAVIASRGVEQVEANAWSPGPFFRVERWVSSDD